MTDPTIATALVLDWPTAFAVVGSVVTIIIGLFTYLIASKKMHKPQYSKMIPNGEKIDEKITEVRDRITSVEADVKIIVHKIESLNQSFTSHEHSDEHHFREIHTKMDKMTDILMKILSDEKM